VLKIEDGQTIEANVNIPRAAVRRDVTVHVEWPDGKPAAGVLVGLQEAQSPYLPIEIECFIRGRTWREDTDGV